MALAKLAVEGTEAVEAASLAVDRREKEAAQEVNTVAASAAWAVKRVAHLGDTPVGDLQAVAGVEVGCGGMETVANWDELHI